MGWCHEFVLQVREGCDHPMVAGESACHCDKCGMVCKGRFAGCAAVWERGPVFVPFGHVGVESQVGLQAVADTPRSFAEPLQIDPAPVSVVSPSQPDPTAEIIELRSLLQALRAELQVLNRKIDQTWVLRDDAVNAKRMAAQVMEAAENLPNRIVGALAAALEGQHRSIMADVRHAISEGVPDAGSTEMLAGLPARLASQIDELGDRFDRRLRDLSHRVQVMTDAQQALATAGQGPDGRNSAILAEIDQLTRVVAGTMELLGQPATGAQPRSGSNGSKPLASDRSS